MTYPGLARNRGHPVVPEPPGNAERCFPQLKMVFPGFA